MRVAQVFWNLISIKLWDRIVGEIPTLQGMIFSYSVPAAQAQPLQNLWRHGSLEIPCTGRPRGPLGWSTRRSSQNFQPFTCKYMCRNHQTQFHLQAIRQNSTTKHYNTLVYLLLVFGHHGRLTSKQFKTLYTP